MKKFNDTHKQLVEQIVAEEGVGKSLLAAGLLGLGAASGAEAKNLTHTAVNTPSKQNLTPKQTIRTPLGIKINNLGNIKYDPNTKWEGRDGEYKGFVKFTSPEYGVRALFRLVRTYNTRYNLDTISKIITRYAPPKENDTASYIQDVSKELGIDPHTKLNLADPNVKSNLVRSIIKRETGYKISPDLLYKGLKLESK